jgi:hypothetical protein
MAWVRYDDQFHDHHKVTAVVAENVAAIGLHALANTWTNGQKRKGYVPAHQAGALVCDKVLGPELAALLVKNNLWHRVADIGACVACAEEYEALPKDLEGWVFHNSREYRAPERDRTTPGTNADLSAKRRAAGASGGRASAAKRREQSQQAERAKPDADSTKASNEQVAGVSKTSNLSSAGVTPDPDPVPEEQTPPTPQATSAQSPMTEDENPGEGESPEQDRTTNLTLVAEVRELRPEWTTSAILRALNDPGVLERPQHLVAAALLAVARDRQSRFPGRLAANGPWWITSLASAFATPTPPAYKAPAVREQATDEGKALALDRYVKDSAWYTRSRTGGTG